MSKKSLIAFIIVVIVIIGGVYYLTSRETAPISIEETDKRTTTIDETNSLPPERIGPYKGDVLAGTKAVLIDYNKYDYEKALKSDKLVVLYFYANWCPICRREVETALYPAFDQLDTNGVIGFRVNFKDSDLDNDEAQLALQFGVANQHTKVFLKNNQRVLKAPDSWELARYQSEINKALAE